MGRWACFLLATGCLAACEGELITQSKVRFPGDFLNVTIDTGGRCEPFAKLGCGITTTYEHVGTHLRVERIGTNAKEATVSKAEARRIENIVEETDLRHILAVGSECNDGIDATAWITFTTTIATESEPIWSCVAGDADEQHPYAQLYRALIETSEAHFGPPAPQPVVHPCVTANDDCAFTTEAECSQAGGTWDAPVKCADGRVLVDLRADADGGARD